MDLSHGCYQKKTTEDFSFRKTCSDSENGPVNIAATFLYNHINLPNHLSIDATPLLQKCGKCRLNLSRNNSINIFEELKKANHAFLLEKESSSVKMLRFLNFLLIKQAMSIVTIDCRHALENKTALLRKYKLKPLDEIPETNSIFLKIKSYYEVCDIANVLLEQIDKNDFSSCDRAFAGNEIYIDSVKVDIERQAKLACETKSYLITLLRCRSHGQHVERELKSFIESFDFIDEDEFEEICCGLHKAKERLLEAYAYECDGFNEEDINKLIGLGTKFLGCVSFITQNRLQDLFQFGKFEQK